MLDKRSWSSLVYVVIFFVVVVTVWQISTYPEHISTAACYNLYTSNGSAYAYPVGSLPADDYHQLIDLTNFTFTVLNLPCNDSAPLLLVLVHSDPRNWETRRMVRSTWGKTTDKVKVLFVIGLVREARVRARLDRENEEHADLVQGSFYDAYRNMTYKHVSVFKYAIYHCPQARYVLKTDDDVFVNMPRMLRFLTEELSPFGGSDMLFCTVRRRSSVVRSWRSKWRVSFEEYPAKTYPPYCPGWAVLYSPDVVFALYREAQRTAYFWIDDVHITGTLAAKIRVGHVDVDSLVLSRRDLADILRDRRRAPRWFLYGAPNVNNGEIEALWRYVRLRDSPPTPAL